MTKQQIINKRSRAEGKTFEQVIQMACSVYSLDGIAEIAKNEEPRQVIGRTGGRKSQMICVNAKKSLPDFTGTLRGGQSIVFEAKHTGGDKILYTRVTDHQREILERHEKLGAKCYIFVSFEMRRFFFLPYGVWRDMAAIFGRKYIKARDDLSEYEISNKGGFLAFLEGIVDDDER